jgi:hypothetical protein
MTFSKVCRREGVDGYLEVGDPVKVFYGDVDAAIARQAVAQLGYLSYAAREQPLRKWPGRRSQARTSSAKQIWHFHHDSRNSLPSAPEKCCG